MATRESEKQLMKELEQAVKDLDSAKQNALEAKAIYDVEIAKLTKAQDNVDAISGAISALRRESWTSGRDKIVKEARNSIEKEKPVA